MLPSQIKCDSCREEMDDDYITREITVKRRDRSRSSYLATWILCAECAAELEETIKKKVKAIRRESPIATSSSRQARTASVTQPSGQST